MLKDRSVQFSDHISVLSHALAAAGDHALSLFHLPMERRIEKKSSRDFVSDADHAVEWIVRDKLQTLFPNDNICGEELGGDISAAQWIIDPIDGTSNFLSGLPFWCISIAYMQGAEPILGGINVPALGYSVIGGSMIDLQYQGIKPHISTYPSSVFGLGQNEFWPKKNRQAVETMVKQGGFNPVSYGSCALSLLYVALGQLAGYQEKRVGGIWDCAGGIALCRANAIRAEYTIDANGNIDVFAGVEIREKAKQVVRGTSRVHSK